MAKFEVGSQDEDLPRTVIGVESSSPVQGGRGNGSAFRRQLSAAVVFVSFNLMYGIAITYTSIAVPSWNEDPKTPFNLTENDAGLHGSIVNVGALAGGLLGGILVTWLGNKWQLILSQIPLTISWLLLAYPPSKFVMMMGRVLTGIAVEVHMVSATMYLSDIAAPKNRGRLTSLTQIAMNIGNILVYATGLFLDWRQTAFLFGAIPILIAAFAMNFPESPSYLLSKGREDKALHSLAWYRGQSNEYSQDEKHLAPILAEQYNMKAIIVICFLSAAFAAPRPDGFLPQALHRSHEIDDGPAYYQFAYEIRDDRTQNFQARHETLNGDDLSGSYSVVLPDGRLQIVNQYNMKAIIVICFLSAALAAPRPDGFAAQALHGSHEIDDGPAHYQFAYEIRDDRSQNFQRAVLWNLPLLDSPRIYGDDGEGFYANIKYVPQQIFTNFKIVEATPSHLSSYRSREIQDS
ncbi:unnamed protein product [Cyprideis torosa]|uniref:Uncharacterized protein n=1 Tax=Cyprideis torosa TaxID=163714 RepID=A0A7R8ZQ43_9CRUS|nr:unnamed protein product [Cyprideis torosa]CAG0889777.1 unnamed protein product [Cyprideis torosa]